MLIWRSYCDLPLASSLLTTMVFLCFTASALLGEH
jgi:hypothetical protein